MKYDTHSQRNEFIDFAKGLAIALVVFGHAIQFVESDFSSNILFTSIYSFHMPLFFVLTGIGLGLSTGRKGSVLNVDLKRKFFTLYAPFLLWSLLLVSFTKNESLTHDRYFDVLLNPFLGYWFLDILFFSFLFAKLALGIFRRKWICFIIIAFAVGLDYIAHKNLEAVFRTYFIIYYAVYIFSGYWVGIWLNSRTHNLWVATATKNKYTLFFAATVMLFFLSINWGYGDSSGFIEKFFLVNGYTDVLVRYGYRFFVVCSAFLFILALYILIWDRVCELFAALGRLSLEIYLVHLLIMQYSVDYSDSYYIVFGVVATATFFVIMAMRMLALKSIAINNAYRLFFGRSVTPEGIKK